MNFREWLDISVISFLNNLSKEIAVLPSQMLACLREENSNLGWKSYFIRLIIPHKKSATLIMDVTVRRV